MYIHYIINILYIIYIMLYYIHYIINILYIIYYILSLYYTANGIDFGFLSH